MANMQPSQELLNFIKSYEQLRLDAYADSKGVPTIGYGHTENVELGTSISQQQAQTFLIQDLQSAVDAVNENVTVPLSQNQFDALVDFAFNVGVAKLNPDSQHVASFSPLLNSGDYDAAPAGFVKYNGIVTNGVKTVLQGLVDRRFDESNMFINGTYQRTYKNPANIVPQQLPQSWINAAEKLTSPSVELWNTPSIGGGDASEFLQYSPLSTYGSYGALSSLPVDQGSSTNSYSSTLSDQLPSVGEAGLNQSTGNSGTSVGFATPEMEQAIFGNTPTAAANQTDDQLNNGLYGSLPDASAFGTGQTTAFAADQTSNGVYGALASSYAFDAGQTYSAFGNPSDYASAPYANYGPSPSPVQASAGDSNGSWDVSGDTSIPSNGFSSYPLSGYDDGGDGGVGYDEPVVLDLTGNGINITQLSSSSTFFDLTGNGQQNLTAWAGAGNGVLFYDPTGTGQLTQADQIDFTDWDPGATSDLQALEDVFDTNHDGSLDSSDANFADFYVMETNANGTQTAVSLASLGITAINLTANAMDIALPDGSSIDGETTYTISSGGTGTAATVTFAYDPEGNAVTTTTTTNADGSTTIDNVALNADGSLAYQNILNTLITTSTSNGITTTTTDKVLSTLNNGGIVETLQTDDIVATSSSSGSSSTETLTNYEGGTVSATGALTSAGTTGAELRNSTTTTTAAISGGTQVTILRDQTGGGWTTQEEVDTTYTSGGSSEVISDLNPNGSVSDVETTTTTVSGSGSTTTQTNEIDGNSAYLTSSVDVISIAAASGSTPGTETETVTDSAGTTVTSLVTTVTVTTSDSVTATTTSDLTDGSTLDLTSVSATVTNSDGSTTITQTDTSANGTLLDETVTSKTPQGGGGLITVVTSSELDGGSFQEVGSETTTISSAGATETTTVVDDSANGTLLDESVTTSTVGSAAGSVTIYGNGDGEVTSTQTVTVSGGTTTGLEEDLAGNGALIDATETVTSDGGLSKTTYTDANGAGTASAPVYDYETTDVTTTSAGVETEIVTDYGASTSDEIDQTKTVTSANGLTTTTYSDFTGANFIADGSWDQITTDQTVVNNSSQTANVTETITTTDGAGNVLETVTQVTSEDRRTVTTTTTLGTTNLAKMVETDVTEANGSVVDTVLHEDYNGDILGATVTTTSADGLVQSVQTDVQGQSAATYAADGLSFDRTTTDTTTINANGSGSETENVTSENGTLLSTASSTTSANGLTITTTDNPYATADYATETVDVTTYNANGSQTETVSDYSYNGALIDQTTTTTSASGLSTTVLYDLNGAGSTNQSSTDVTTINANGSQTEVVTDYTGGTSGTVRDVTTTTSGIIVAGAGQETTIATQSNGSVLTYQFETIMPGANGTTTDITKYYSMSGGALLMTTTDTTSANGLVTTDGTSIGTDTTNDFWTTDTTVLNANGSQTETAANYNQAGLISETVTTSYPNGLSTVTEEDANGAVNGSGAAIFNLVTTDDTVLNSNGSHTETVTDSNASGATIEQTVTTTSADQQTITKNRYLDETGTITTLDQSETVQTQANGLIIDTTTSYGTSHQTLGTILKTTSGNGLDTSTTYNNASGTATDTQTNDTTYDSDGDGGTLDNFEDTDVVNGTNFTTSREAQSTGNDQSTTINLVLAGALASTNVASFTVATHDSIAIALTGITTETITDTIGTATSPNDTETIVTAADGLQKTTSITLGSPASAFIVDQATTNVDGSKTEVTTYYNPASLSTIEDRVTVNTSWDGRTIQTTTQSDYDGTHYNDETKTAVKNANNTITETLSFTGSFNAPASQQTVNIVTNTNESVTTTTLNYLGSGSGTLNGQIVSEVSPDGLVKSFVEDTTGSETITNLDAAAADLISGTALPTSMLGTDIIGLDMTTLNADGSTTEVLETAFGDSLSNLRSKTTTTTSSNGLSITTDIDNDGNGVNEQIDTTTVAPDGSKAETFDYYGDTSATASTLEQSNSYTVSANGLETQLITSTGITDTTVDFADSNGSYEWSRSVTSGSAAASAGYAQGSATHDIGANGIDTWSWSDGSSGGTSGTITIAVATETQDIAIANEIYETLLGQPMDDSQTQYLAQYITNGVLNRQALATAIVNSSAYTSDYALPETVNNDQYTLLGGFDVVAGFENDLGRLPTVAESAVFDPLISNPTAANIATMAVAVAQYATDLGEGNDRTLTDLNQGLVSLNPIWAHYVTASGTYSGSNGVWIDGGLSITLDGNNDTIDAATDSDVTADGSGDTIDSSGNTVSFANSSSGTVDGNNNNITLQDAGGSTLNISGTGDTVASNINVIDLDSSSNATIQGSNNTINGGDNAIVVLNGSNNSLALGSTSYVDVLSGSDEIIDQSNGQTNADANVSGTLYGSNDVLGVVTGSSFNVVGNANTIYEDSGASISIYGSGNTATGTTSSDFNISGYNNLVSVGNGSMVDVGSGSGDTIYESDSLTYTNNGVGLTINGSDDTISLLSGSSSDISGDGNIVGLGGDNDFVDISGNGDIYLANGISGSLIYADNSAIYEGSGDAVTIEGSGDYISGDSSDFTDYDGTYYDGGNDGGWDGGGDGGYYGYGGYDFAVSSKVTSVSSGFNIGAIAQYDQNIGAFAAVTAAENAKAQALAALAATGEQGAATTAVFEGPRWGGSETSETNSDQASGLVITWSFATSPGTATDPFSSYLSSQYQSVVEQAMQAWASASGLTLEEVPDSTASDIRIGWGDFDTQDSSVFGYTSFEAQNGTIQPGAIIRLEDPSEMALVAAPNGQLTYAGTDTTLYQLVLHEIGHALGLADDADPNSVMYPTASSSNLTLDQTDISGIQELYGANASLLSTSTSAQPALTSAFTSALASTNISGLNQMIQLMAGFGAQPSSSTASPLLAAQSFALAQQLAAPLHPQS